jgi:hypothetical protein
MLCYKRIFLIELVGSLFFLFFHSAEAEPLGFDFFSSPGRVSHYTFLVGLAQVYSKELVIEQTGQPVNHAPKSRAYYPFDQPIIGPVLMIDGEHFASPEKRWGFNWSVMPLYYRVQAGTYRLVDENDVLYVQSPASDLFLFFVGAGPVVHYPMNRGSVYAGAQLMGTLGWQTNTNNGEGDAYGREFNAAERSFAIENDLPIPSGSYGGLMDKSHDDFRESLTPPFGGGFNENDATQI